MRKKIHRKIYPYWIIEIEKLIHNSKVKNWCGLPYPGHPKGCPNFFRKDKPKCPYNSPYITDVLDLNKPIYIVFSEFDLKTHCINMKKKHPEWSDKMCKNVLYWQSRSRKQMMERAKKALKITNSNLIIPMGESLGVNLYVTCRKAGLKLKKIKDIDICHHITIIGRKK